MKALSVFFKVLGHVWMGLVGIAMIISIIGMFLAEPSLYLGWKRVTATFSPFNIGNTLFTIIAVLPGLGCYKASEYFGKKIK